MERYVFENCYSLSIFLNTDSIPSIWNENWNNTNCKVYLKDAWQYLDGEPISSYYQIWFYAYDYDMSLYDRTIKYGEEVILPIIENSCYTFNGWIINVEVINDSFIYNFT